MAIVAPAGFKDSGNSELLAMIELMYLVAQADGVFSPEERREFLGHVESLSEGRVGSRELALLVEHWSAESAPPIGERLAHLAEQLPDETSRRIAYGLALEVADADGEFVASEGALLKQIAVALGLEASESEDISRAVRMSSRPPKP